MLLYKFPLLEFSFTSLSPAHPRFLVSCAYLYFFPSIYPLAHLALSNKASLPKRCLLPLGSQRLFAVYIERRRCPATVGIKRRYPYNALVQPTSLHRGRFLYYLQILIFSCFCFSENFQCIFLECLIADSSGFDNLILTC